MRLGDWSAREIEILNTWMLLTAKPAVYLVNMSKKDYIRKKNKWLPKLFEWVQAHGGDPIIPFSGVFENEVGWWAAGGVALLMPQKACSKQETDGLAVLVLYFCLHKRVCSRATGVVSGRAPQLGLARQPDSWFCQVR